jgi:hypothetical protein
MDSIRREVNQTMARNLTKIVAVCASVLIVLFALACSSQTTQDATKPSTETSQAPAPEGQQQAAPSDQAAPAQEQAPAPAQGQQQPQQ